MLYIVYSEIKMTDKMLIKWFIDYAIESGWNQSKMAKVVGRTRSWASDLVNGNIRSLNFDTRHRIKSILGIGQ